MHLDLKVTGCYVTVASSEKEIVVHDPETERDPRSTMSFGGGYQGGRTRMVRLNQCR